MEHKEIQQPTRAGNLTAADRAVIIDLAQKFWATIENKKSDAVTIKQKTGAWQMITAEFNSQTQSKRSAQQLKQVLSPRLVEVTI